jgi:hypothetical protein
MERMIVSNGSKRIERNQGTALMPQWVASKVEDAGNLKPGVYQLHAAKPAVPDGKTVYTGNVIHADAKHVYQERGVNNLVRHDRAAFQEAPTLGKYARIGYENGRAVQVEQERGQSRGISR